MMQSKEEAKVKKCTPHHNAMTLEMKLNILHELGSSTVQNEENIVISLPNSELCISARFA